MASSDSFVIYIESSTGLNFTVLASSDDKISSIKKKVEAQHLTLSPQHGRIFVQDIKRIYPWYKYFQTECYLPDNIPVHCLFDGAKGIISLFITTRDSPVLAETHNLCQNASSDSFIIYIELSKSEYESHTFAMLATSDDDITSIKKKAAAQHLALFPEDGRIVVRDIQICHEEIFYYLPDNIPVHYLFDGAMGILVLLMDAVEDPPDSVETRADGFDLCQNASSDSYVIYMRMSNHFNFALLATSDDNISSVKKKAEALYPALCLWSIKKIVAQAIKITHEGKKYFLPDNIPVHCLFDGANNKGILSLFMDVVEVPLNLTESPTHILNLCQNAGSDSFVIYIRSSSDLNFAVLASSDDDISSLKKKAAAQHLALFPHDGRIVSQAIKIIHEWNKMHGPRTYIVPDDIPVRCLFDVANKGICLLYMDAVTVPLDLTETRDPSSGRDRNCSLNQHHGGNTNTRCTSEALKRKSPGDNTNKDPVVAEALKRKSLGDNTNFGILLDAVSVDMVVLNSAHEGNGSYNEKENNMALEKKARKEVGYTGLTTNAGERSSLAPSGRVTLDNQIKQASQPIPKADKEKMKKSQNNSISATDEKESHGSGRPKKNKMEIDASQVTVIVSDELRCCRTNGSRWHCSEKAMPNSKFCTRHFFPCKSASSKQK